MLFNLSNVPTFIDSNNFIIPVVVLCKLATLNTIKNLFTFIHDKTSIGLPLSGRWVVYASA